MGRRMPEGLMPRVAGQLRLRRTWVGPGVNPYVRVSEGVESDVMSWGVDMCLSAHELLSVTHGAIRRWLVADAERIYT